MASRDQRQRQETDATAPSGALQRLSPLDDPPPFSEKDYRIAASDSNGRSERIWIRLPPYLVRAVQVMVSSKTYPWETPGEAFRFAVYWGLRLLRDKPPPVTTIFAQVQAMNDILVREQDNLSFRAVFDRMNDVLAEYQREGAIDEARRVLAELDARINQMPAGYWQTKYKKQLRDRFGMLMRGEKMVLGLPARVTPAAVVEVADPDFTVMEDSETTGKDGAE